MRLITLLYTLLFYCCLIQPLYTLDTTLWFKKLLPCKYHSDAVNRLIQLFDTHVIAQPSATTELIALIKQHIEIVQRSQANSDNIQYASNKPLVLSLHGLTGTGKSLSTALIIEALYGIQANELGYVYKFHGKRYDTQNINRHIYDITQQLQHTIQRCSTPIYVFEEIHYMTTGVLDGLLPYMDYRAIVDGDNYNNAIFILTSNFAGQALQKLAYDAEQQNVSRDKIQYDKVKQTIQYALTQPYNTVTNDTNTVLQQRNKLQLLVDHSVVNRFIPFYPLYKQHVKQCITLQLQQLESNYINNKQISKLTYDINVVNILANKLQYRGSISIYGCKNINDIITIDIVPLISKHMYKIEPVKNYDILHNIANQIYTVVHSTVHGSVWSLSDKQVHLYSKKIGNDEIIDIEVKDVYKPELEQRSAIDVYGNAIPNAIKNIIPNVQRNEL